MSGIDCPFHGGQSVEGVIRQGITLGEEGDEEIPGPGSALAALWPAYTDLVITSIQKYFGVWTALAGRFLECTLAPVLEPVQCCLDVLAGAQAVDTVVGAVAAIYRFGQ